MNLPHDIRFLVHPFFLRAIRRWGFADQMMKANRAAATFQLSTSKILLGDRSRAQEADLIDAIAELEVYLSALVTALDVQSETRSAIQAKLDQLTSEVLTK
jgi:hypothetical protein